MNALMLIWPVIIMPLICSIWPTAYMTHMPHYVSYATGINYNISSYPIFDGYFGYIWVIWVIVSHISHLSHNESWWVIWLTWVMLSPHLCWIFGYFGLLLISRVMSHRSHNESWWIIWLTCVILSHISHFESYKSIWVR